jgi:hypothetical protein
MELTGNDSIFTRRLYPEPKTNASTSVQAEADTKHSEEVDTRRSGALSTEHHCAAEVARLAEEELCRANSIQAQSESKTEPIPTEPC